MKKKIQKNFKSVKPVKKTKSVTPKKRTSQPQKTAAAKPSVKDRKTGRIKKRIASAPVANAGIQPLLEQLLEIKNLLIQPPKIRLELEDGVDSIRRLLSEMMEKHAESIAAEIVAIRSFVSAATESESIMALEKIDSLLDRFGVTSFEATPGDYVDPLIHVISAQRRSVNMPEGVITETLRPGYKTGRGIILAKATVSISKGN